MTVLPIPKNRWHELCSRCHEKCKNTGSWWIDETRVCGLCRRVLEDDVKELQRIAAALHHEKPFSKEQLVELLKRIGADRLYVVKERKK